MTLERYMIGAAIFDLGPWVSVIQVQAWLKHRVGHAYGYQNIKAALHTMGKLGLLDRGIEKTGMQHESLTKWAMSEKGVAHFLAERRLVFKVYGCPQASDGLPIVPRAKNQVLTKAQAEGISKRTWGGLMNGVPAEDRTTTPAVIDVPPPTKAELSDEDKFAAYVERMRKKI